MPHKAEDHVATGSRPDVAEGRAEIRHANQPLSRTDFEFENRPRLVIAGRVIHHLNDGAICGQFPALVSSGFTFAIIWAKTSAA